MKRNERKYIYALALALCLFLGLISGVRAKAAGTPVYRIMVNRAANCVTVYRKGEDGKYSVPVRAFVCSVGRAGHETPLGTYKTSDYYQWGYMVDGSYGRYCIRFNGGILFHSVPYYTRNPGDLEWEQYNKLGEPASLGCVRLAWADAKWLFENCGRGTEVIVYDDAENPGPLGKPTEIKLLAEYPMKQWDPTNTDEGNEWNTLRPKLYQKDGYTDGVLRVPVGSSPDYIYNLIGLMECNGYFCNPGEYTLTMFGTYDLNTPGRYVVSLIGDGVIDVRSEEYLLTLVVGEL